MFETQFEKYTAIHIIQALQPYVTSQRQQRINTVIANRLMGVQCAVEASYDPHNAAAIQRSAEALGVLNIHMIEQADPTLAPRKITQGTSHWLALQHHAHLTDFLRYAQAQPLLLAGATPHTDRLLTALPVDQPLCLVFGNEHAGLSPSALAACDIHFKIPMCGMCESFNVSVAAAITLFDVTQRYRTQQQCSSDLTIEQQQQLQAWYFMNSINNRLLNALLPC